MTTEQFKIAKKIPQDGILQGMASHYGKHLLNKEKIQKSKSKIDGKVSVFLVDDDKFFLNGLYYFLSDSLSPKITLKTFSTAEDCIKAMKEKPEIIVMDYMLNSETPGAINGLAALKEINKISPKTFVVMLSAQDSIDVALETLNNGAYDYLSKSETAFLRLKNIIKNVAETILETNEQARVEKVIKRINMIIIFVLLLLLLFGRVLTR